MSERPGDFRITGVDIPLGEMVVLFTKVAVALIPAFIIYAIVTIVVSSLLGRMFIGSMMP